MATINLGAIKFNWKGAYNSGTSYAVDDVVSSGGNSYVCIQAHSNQAVGNATAYWNIMATKGTNGTDGTDADLLSIGSTAQGDLYYNSGSAIARLGAGTSGQYLETKGTGQNPVWSTVSTGAYSLAQLNLVTLALETHAGSNNTAYVFGTAIQVTPSASTDLIELSQDMNVEGQQQGYYGLAFGVNTSDSWGSTTGDSRLKISSGEHAMGMGNGDDSERYQRFNMSGIYSLSDLGMSAGTNYYVRPHILTHSPAGQIKTGGTTTNSSNAGQGKFTLKRWSV